jgi:hypothetical protein
MRRHTTLVLQTFGVLLAVSTLAAATFASATDASYTAVTCSGVAPRDNLFEAVRSAPHEQLASFSICPAATPDPYVDLRQGIGTYDAVGPSADVESPSDGRYAEHRFSAPPGTRVVGASITRDIGNRGDLWRNYGRIDGVDQPDESCSRGPGQAFCRVTGTATFTGLDARSIAYGVRCEHQWGGCPTGALLHEVWATILAATITLDDVEAPTVGGLAAVGLADGGWHRGSGQVTFSASDNTGVFRRRLVEGSVVRAEWTAPGAAAGGCGTKNVGDAYTYAQPCAEGRGLNGARTLTVADVCAWGDGAHQVKAVAFDVDLAQATSSGSATVNVDCSAPVVEVAPARIRFVAAGSAVAPEVGVADSASGVAGREVQVQAGTDGPWKDYSGPIVARADATYRFRARATDVAGNTSAWTVPSAWTVVNPAAPVPDEQTPAPPAPQPGRASDAPTRPIAPPAVLPASPRPAGAGPKVAVTSARHLRAKRVLKVSGTASGDVTVKAVVRLRRGTKTVTRRLRTAGGRFRGSVRLPRGVRGKVRVTALVVAGDGRAQHSRTV